MGYITWTDNFEENVSRVCQALGIQRPEETTASVILIVPDKGEVTYSPCEGKYKSLAFMQLAAQKGWSLEQIKQEGQRYFGPAIWRPDHGGLVADLIKAVDLTITMPYQEEKH